MNLFSILYDVSRLQALIIEKIFHWNLCLQWITDEVFLVVLNLSIKIRVIVPNSFDEDEC